MTKLKQQQINVTTTNNKRDEKMTKKMTIKEKLIKMEMGKLWENYGKERVYIDSSKVVNIDVENGIVEDYELSKLNAWKARELKRDYIDCRFAQSKVFYDCIEKEFYSIATNSAAEKINNIIIERLRNI